MCRALVVLILFACLLVSSTDVSAQGSRLGDAAKPAVLLIDGASPVSGLRASEPRKSSYLFPIFDESESIDAKVGDFRWSGNIFDTPKAVRELEEQLPPGIQGARSREQAVVLVTHSWGSVLAYLAIRNLERRNALKPGDIDLLVTIHTPLGMRAPNRNLAGALFAGLNELKARVNAHTGGTVVPLRSVQKWHNYYSQGDLLSGLIAAASGNVDTERNHTLPTPMPRCSRRTGS